jgi:N-acetylmuramoyl-L-alanine amidase
VVRQEPAPASPPQAAEAELRPTTDVWDDSIVRVGEAREDGVAITYGLHSVRLGGPWLGRMPKGTRFRVVGQQGDNLKIALGKSLSGWVAASRVSLLPEGTPVPHNYFTGCDVSGNDQYDVVSIGLREKIVFAVRSDSDSTLQGRSPNRLYVDFFNTHHALTWISHKSGARIVGPVTGEQMEEDWFRLTLPLSCRQIWGYWTELQGNTLRIHIRRPPTIAEPPDSPLKDLLFALEAGHGGSGSGAVGRMGTKEKDVNLSAVLALKDVLEQRGARTVLVRPRDSSPSLQERVDRTNQSGADFFVSMHANAAGNTRGYLAISGTSTYYLDAHCYLPADLVYRRLLDLDWQEFGVVGNFSYYPLTNTRTPGILVEQAFMSNPYDEARLLDPAYQQAQAEAIADGLEEFFAAARE